MDKKLKNLKQDLTVYGTLAGVSTAMFFPAVVIVIRNPETINAIATLATAAVSGFTIKETRTAIKKYKELKKQIQNHR